MRPKFNNKKQTVLWNVLAFGTAVAAGFAAAAFSHQHNMAALIATIAVAVAIFGALYWWGYRTRRMEVANEIMEENRRKTRHENSADEPQRVNIYDVRVHNSPAKVIMEAVTILLLIITWGIIWSQHNWGWNSISCPLILTIGSVAALIAARFPFMMNDADEHNDMSQISLSVKKQQIYALALAAMAVLSFLLDIQLGLIGMFFIFCIVESYFDRRKKAKRNQGKSISDQLADNRFDRSSIQVGHSKEEIYFYAIISLIVLLTLCLLVLSYDVIMGNLSRYGFRILIIVTLASLAFNQLVKAVKFARADEDLQNIRQFHLGIRENRVGGVMFALMGLLIAIDIYHRVLDPVVTVFAIIVLFFAPYFIFKPFIQKATDN